MVPASGTPVSAGNGDSGTAQTLSRCAAVFVPGPDFAAMLQLHPPTFCAVPSGVFSGHPPPVLPDVAVEDVLWFVQFMFPGSSGTGTEMPAAGEDCVPRQGNFRQFAPNVFVAGDMHSGQSLVVRAIRDGRDAAREVDEALMGYTNL